MLNKVTIIAENPTPESTLFRATWRDRESVGKTAGVALDALTEQIPASEAGTLVVVQNLKPDSFFDASQQQRLEALLLKQREAKSQGLSLSTDEESELERLVAQELSGSQRRTAAIADELGL